MFRINGGADLLLHTSQVSLRSKPDDFELALSSKDAVFIDRVLDAMEQNGVRFEFIVHGLLHGAIWDVMTPPPPIQSSMHFIVNKHDEFSRRVVLRARGRIPFFYQCNWAKILPLLVSVPIVPPFQMP